MLKEYDEYYEENYEQVFLDLIGDNQELYNSWIAGDKDMDKFISAYQLQDIIDTILDTGYAQQGTGDDEYDFLKDTL